MWKVYHKAGRYRIGEEKSKIGGIYWYEAATGKFWESSIKADAFIQVKHLNTPKTNLKWEIIEK